MNAMQTRELMRVSRRALAMLDPSWGIHRELSSVLDAAVLAAPVKRKAGKRDAWAGAIVGSAWTGPHGILYRLHQEQKCLKCSHDGSDHTPVKRCSCGCETYKAEDERFYTASDKCAHCEHESKAHRAASKCLDGCGCRKYRPTKEMQPNICVEAKKLDELRAKLRYCACGHWADAHAKDELENLLKCGASGCDCDHFHYAAATDAAQEAA